MDISRELLFFFSAIGAFNGLLMGLYFLVFAKPKHLTNRFLGALLICLSIRIGKSVIFYFNPDLSFGYLQFGLTACLFIGPFLYFYARLITFPDSQIRRNYIYHLLILVPGILILGMIYPFEHHIDLWRPWFITGIYLVWLGYSILTGYVIRGTLKKLFSPREKLKSLEVWVVSIFFGNLSIWAAYYFCGIMSYILGALLFSFMLYLLFLIIIFKRKNESILFKNQIKYKDKKIGSSEAKILLDKLKGVVEGDKLYNNPNLKLSDIAKKLNILPHTISQLLNDNLGISFPQFLNSYRIEEAKRLLEFNANHTLESIGYDCGFNSKSTFYSTFKKITGTTPAKYKEGLLGN